MPRYLVTVPMHFEVDADSFESALERASAFAFDNWGRQLTDDLGFIEDSTR
jgi:hypothetical protein